MVSSLLRAALLHPGEEVAHTKARGEAFWAERVAFEQAASTAARAARRPAVSRLAAFCDAAANSAARSKGAGGEAAAAGLPTGVMLAGGINALDSAALADVCAALREAGHGVACVHARAFKGAGASLSAVLKASAASMLQGEAARRLANPSKETRSAAKGKGKKGKGKEAERSLAADEKRYTSGGGGGAWDLAAFSRWRNAERSGKGALVWVVDGIERFDPEALTDLLSLLADARDRRGMPVAVLAVLQTSAGALQQALPSATAQRLAPTVFSFPSPRRTIDALLGATVLATAPGAPTLGLGGACLHALSQALMCHHDSAAYVTQVLREAQCHHFAACPLAALAAPAAVSSKAALTAAVKAAPKQALAALASSAGVGVKQLPAKLWDLLERRRAQAAALRWAAAVGESSLMELLLAVSDDSAAADDDAEDQGGNGEPRGAAEVRAALSTLRAMGTDGDRAALAAVLRRWARVEAPVILQKEAARILALLEQADDAEVNANGVAEGAASLLSAVTRTHLLGAAPLDEPLAAPWRYDVGWQAIADALHPAPRARALAHMAAGAPSPEARGSTASKDRKALAAKVDCAMDDTAMAWALLGAHGEHAPVAQWYREMCHVYIKGGQCGTRAGKAKRGRKRKAATSLEAFEVDDTLQGLSASDRAMLQARFSRAAGELQLMGAIRSTTKRSDTVQRLVFDHV